MRRRPFTRASSGLAVDGLGGIKADAARGSICHGALHAGLDLRDELFDIEMALDPRQQPVGVFLRPGILQIVQRATVRYRADESGEFERRQRDAVAEAGHHSHAVLGWRRRHEPRLLAFNIETRLFAQSKQMRIVAHAFEAQLLAQAREVQIVRSRQRFRHRYRGAAVQPDARVALDYGLAERRQRHWDLYGRARLETIAEG